jgi:hypothetical protein
MAESGGELRKPRANPNFLIYLGNIFQMPTMCQALCEAVSIHGE